MKNSDTTTNKNKSSEDKSIISDGSIITGDEDFKIYTMTIIGQVEGHYVLPPEQKSTKYEHLIPLLVAAEESASIDGMLIILNTVGGDVEAGLALAEMIASMSLPTVSLVLGGGHSIGVPLAVCAKKSFIVPSATMTLHPVRMNGLVINAPQSFDYFNRMQERIINFITAHSGADANKLRNMIMKADEMATDIGTILDGQSAVDEKIIDNIGGLQEALGELKGLIRERKSSKPPIS